LICRLHPLAKAEIDEAARWYQGRGEGLDQRFVTAVQVALELIEVNPKRYAKLETLGVATEYQRALVRKFPYFIVFRVFHDEVFVYAVAHGSRRPNYWLSRRRRRK
jgi:toxin ParE1/3/4